MHEKLSDEIERLKKDQNVVILAHNYQRPEIQDVADFIGDSLALSRKARDVDADVILFCGVDFMAETAKILNPDKKVVIPDNSARCPMAKMLYTDDLLKAKKMYPDAEVVLYINTLAEAKMYADCVCTSANAGRIIDAMETDIVLFGPDKNLTYYASKFTDKEIITIPENGFCPTHHMISGAELLEAKEKHPEAKVVVHPECIPEVQDAADFIASTEGMVKFCKNDSSKEFIIGTEIGLVYRLKKEIPEKSFYALSEKAICPTMKMHTIDKVIDSLKTLSPEVKVPKKTAARALKAIERMLEIG